MDRQDDLDSKVGEDLQSNTEGANETSKKFKFDEPINNEMGKEHDDNTSCTTDSSNDDGNETEDEDLTEDEEEIPLFKYARLVGSLPRTETHPFCLSPQCNTTAMGKGACPPPPTGTSSKYSTPTINLGMAIQQTPMEEMYFPVVAIGLKNGEIHLLDVQTGLTLLDPNKPLNIISNHTTVSRSDFNGKHDAVVCMSFDSSGKYLAACRMNGDVVIFELKYHYASRKKMDKKSNSSGTADNVFTSFFGNYSQSNTSQMKANSIETNAGLNEKMNEKSKKDSSINLQRTLDILNSADPIRFSYSTPISKCTLTCLALDPSYARRREKSMVVGFQDGRVLLTKQGFFGRLINTVLYNSGEEGGIESVVWRGGLLAWADASGIKLFDIEQNHRLARIDRPVGARAALYPTISSLRPHLHFEKSDSLLIAWGDCVMTMDIEPPSKQQEEGEKLKKSRTVVCGMAWELDCIACGAQPLDEDHLVILGLVPDDKNGSGNVLELQIVSRKLGTVVSADALLLQDPNRAEETLEEKKTEAKTDLSQKEELNKSLESASQYFLVSSFAMPRMEDEVELEEEELVAPGASTPSMEEDMEKMLNPLGNMGGLMSLSYVSAKFIDSHLRWSISSVATETKDISSTLPEGEEEIKVLLNKPKEHSGKKSNSNSTTYFPPPIMAISSPFDTIVVRTRNTDDTISHYRSKNQHHLALSMGIQHRQIIRQHSLSSLTREYFYFLLSGGDGTKNRAELMNHAARLTPMLIGGDVEMWERWITQFAKVEGGLFALREFIPVRDPKLSPEIYEMALNKMLLEIENICNSPRSTSIRIHAAKRFFLNTLMAWGPIHAITERFQLLSHYVQDRGGEMKDRIAIDLFMRMQQTSKRFLKNSALMMPKEQFETWRHNMREGGASRKNRNAGLVNKSSSITKKDGMTSLYDVGSLASYLEERLPLLDSDKEFDGSSNEITIVLFESVAELQYILRNYDESLRFLLIVGAHFATELKMNTLEEEAVQSIVSPQSLNAETKENDLYSYEHLFAMIEYHNLHRYLLDESFVPNIKVKGNEESKEVPPIVALIRLVGHKLTGKFLMKHCSLPSFNPPSHQSTKSQSKRKKSTKKYSTEEYSSSYLPITLVTKQLQSYPKLLFWYLHLVFTLRPELYVNFPNTYVTPTLITDLHQKHFSLLMDYSEEEENSLGELKLEVDSPMMSFLRSALPHGGVRSIEVRQLLEKRRAEIMSKSNASTALFARELAYVIERSSLGSEEDAKNILQLHLEGSKSMLLAVAYAERNGEYSEMLWDTLVSFCLKPKLSSMNSTITDGSLFQALLEAAAQCGADLAHLVSQIPEGMHIEGLRPMLLTAVADYRLKLKMHEASGDIMSEDKVSLIREITHKSRKGLRAETGWDELSTRDRPTLLSAQGHMKRSRKNIMNHKMRLLAERQSRLKPISLLPI